MKLRPPPRPVPYLGDARSPYDVGDSMISGEPAGLSLYRIRRGEVGICGDLLPILGTGDIIVD